MHGVWNFFIERRQFTTLLIVALVAGGIASVMGMPKESAPEVNVPIVLIHTTLRGASPEDIAQLVTKKIEKQVATVQHLDTLRSSSREGISLITAQFDASADLDKAVRDVKDAVDRSKAELPRDADEPIVTRVSFADQPFLVYSLAGGLPAAEFNRLGNEVKEILEQVPGISRVGLSGTRAQEVQIILRREALAASGISMNDVIGAISAANASVPVGNITVDNIQYAINFEGDLTDPTELNTVVVTTRNGAPVYVTDVADVVNGIARSSSIARVSVDGKPAEPAIEVYLYKQEGENVTTAATAVHEKLQELEQSGGLLSGITILNTFDQGEEVKGDLFELTRTGIITIILVMLILLCTLGWREALVAGFSIPLSFVIAFIGLYASDNTFNVVSLFTLILAIGILVDSGIVVTEAIHTRYKKYGDPIMAARESIREYSWPLIAGTMTTIAVFIPLFFISGIVGQFIKSIPYTLIFVLLASLVVALGFIPPIAIAFTRREMNKMEAMQERWNERINVWYREWLKGILDNRRFQRKFLWSLVVALVLVIMLPITGVIHVIFFPGADSDFVYIDIEAKNGTPLAQTDLAARAVEETLYGNPDIVSFATTIGSSSLFSGGGMGGPTGAEKFANITVKLTPHDERSKTSTEIVDGILQPLQHFNTFTVRLTEQQGGPPSGAPVLIKFTSENLNDLARATDIGERVLANIPETRDIVSSNRNNGNGFTLSIDRAKAAQVGVTPAQIASVLRTAVSGTIATTIVKDETDIDVLVLTNLNPNWQEPADTNVTTVDSIQNISIATPKGQVLLGSLLTSSLSRASAAIEREEQKNLMSVSSYLTQDGNAITVTNEFNKRILTEKIPEGVSITVGGETEDVNKSFREMFFALIAGLVLMLAILVVEFNSFRYSFYLIMLIPLSLVGVLGGLALTGSPISFPSLLGVIALAGVIINHAIILVDSMIVRMKNPQGKTLAEVVVDAAASRLRPIVLTTLTTVIGMLPLSFATGLWGPLAFSIMFGLTFAMILTLVLTPILIYRHPGKQFWNPHKDIGTGTGI